MNAALHTLLAQTVVFSVAVLLVLASTAALRRLGGAQLAYAAWATVPLLTVWQAFSAQLPAPAITVTLPNPVAFASTGQISAAVQPAGANIWVLGALLAWALGLLVFAARLALAQRALVVKLGELIPHCPGVWLSQAEQSAPLVMGLFSPRIVLPQGFFSQYTPDEQALVVAHEVTHMRRADLWANALAAALQCVFWFNPLAHWATRCMTRDQELACDAAVLAERPAPLTAATYAQALLKAHTAPQSNLHPPLICQWQFRQSSALKDRIMELSRPQPRRLLKTLGVTLLASTTALAAYGVLASTATPKPTVKPAPLPGPGQYKLDVQHKSETGSGDTLNTREFKYALIVNSGKVAKIRSDAIDGERCEVDFVTTPASADKVSVAMDINCHGNKSKPKIVTELGKTASIEVGNTSKPNAKRVDKISLVVTQ